MKCICSHYSGLSAAANTRGLTLAVVSGTMYICSCIISLHPVTKGLFAQINTLLFFDISLSVVKKAPEHMQLKVQETHKYLLVSGMHNKLYATQKPASYCER